MLYILFGEDDFSLSQVLDEIKASTGDPALMAANTTTIEGQQVTLDQLRTACETVPFLAEKRLVIIKGLLERFEAKGRPPGRKKTTPASKQQNDYKSLTDYMGNIPDSAIVILVEGRIRNDNPLLKALSPKAKVKSFPLLKGDALQQWVQQRVRQEGSSISSPAVALLTKLVGANLWIMASEINKLVLFTSGRRIEKEDVERIVSHAEHSSVFTMVDAILEFKAGEAGRVLQQLLQGGAPAAYILTMLTRQVRMIVQVKELRNQKLSGIEIQNRLGLASDFALRKTLGLADKYPWERLNQVYHKLLETDLSIKTGKYGGELALNILVAELSQRSRL